MVRTKKLQGVSIALGLQPVFDTLAGPATMELSNRALSLSALDGKSVVGRWKRYGHVLDPRSGEPVNGARAAVVVGECPAMCEALSTALLVNGRGWLQAMEMRFPGYEGMLAE